MKCGNFLISKCQWYVLVKAMNITIKRPDLEDMKPLQPRYAYFSGRNNAARLYNPCQGLEKIHSMDVTSMFPFAISNPRYYYSVKEPTVFIKKHDMFIPIDQVFGAMVLIEASGNLYFPYYPNNLLHRRKNCTNAKL